MHKLEHSTSDVATVRARCLKYIRTEGIMLFVPMSLHVSSKKSCMEKYFTEASSLCAGCLQQSPS